MNRLQSQALLQSHFFKQPPVYRVIGHPHDYFQWCTQTPCALSGALETVVCKNLMQLKGNRRAFALRHGCSQYLDTEYAALPLMWDVAHSVEPDAVLAIADALVNKAKTRKQQLELQGLSSAEIVECLVIKHIASWAETQLRLTLNPKAGCWDGVCIDAFWGWCIEQGVDGYLSPEFMCCLDVKFREAA